MSRTITFTAKVRDAAGHETTKQTTLIVNDPVTDRLSARPNDGSGLWPDFSNTGYSNAPNYPGSLTPFTAAMTPTAWLPVDVPANSTISFKRFTGKIGISPSSHTDNITFVGCLFEGIQPNDLLVLIYCPGKVTFKYCTFRPYGMTLPPGNNGTVSSSKTAPGTPYNKSWQYIANMVGGAVATFDHCDVWGNAGIQCTGGKDQNNPARFTNCYIHDQADTDNSGGGNYHHDGLGPDSEGGSHDTIIDNCTIASRGNTNGIALQGSSTYNRISVTNCYISGWGYAVAIGATSPWNCTNITVTDNIFSTELPCLFGPFYANRWNNNTGNLWRRNKYQVRNGDANTMLPVSAHAKFWWPSDNVAHASDFS